MTPRLGETPWTEANRKYEMPAESVDIGTIVDDERFPFVLEVGHITIGPKWVTFRAYHPEANVFPNTPRRVRRGDTVTVLSRSLPADYFSGAIEHRNPVIYEARCGACGDTFNPHGEDDLIHIARLDGTECGGQGVMLGTYQ